MQFPRLLNVIGNPKSSLGAIVRRLRSNKRNPIQQGSTAY